MSHFTKSKVQIKDLSKLRIAAEKMGLEVTEAEQGKALKYSSRYAGTIDAVMILSQGSGTCAIVEDEDGTYRTIIDNWNNPIVSSVGSDCETLCRDYATELVRYQAMLMGGSVVSQSINKNGESELRIQIQ